MHTYVTVFWKTDQNVTNNAKINFLLVHMKVTFMHYPETQSIRLLIARSALQMAFSDFVHQGVFHVLCGP